MISQKFVQQDLSRKGRVRFANEVPDREARRANFYTYESFWTLFDRVDYMGSTRYYFDNIIKQIGEAKKWGGKYFPSSELNELIQAGNKFYRLLPVVEQALQRQWDKYQKETGTEGESPKTFKKRYK